MISFPCPGCGRGLKVKDEQAGKRGRCPHCRCALTVPGTSAVGARRDAGPEARTVGPGPAAQPRTLGPAPARPGDRETLAHDRALPSAGTVAPDAGIPPEYFDFLAPAQQPDELGRLGPYRVLKVLGAGGMGVVFLAEDPQLKRQLALKAMLPSLAASESARQRFLREAQAAAAVEHDHIVPIFQVGEDRGVPFIAMPFLKGMPLDERLRRQPLLPVAEVLRIGREVAKGLAAAHERGLVHRDIKPANIWLEEQPGEPGASATGGRVKLLDFGLAKAAADNASLTQSGAIVGTPAYMAPEQATGQPLDGRCDLFSLGCVLYRMATGEPAFTGADMVSTLVAVATQQPRPPGEVNPRVPAALSELIMHLLAKQPEQRPASAREVAAALQEMENSPARAAAAPRPAPGTEVTRAPAPRRPVAPAKSRRRRTAGPARRLPVWGVATAGGLLGVLVLAALLVIILKQRNASRTPIGGPDDSALTIRKDALPASRPALPIPPATKAEPLAALGLLDRLRAEDIPPAERFDWQPKELVAVLGEHRQRHWGSAAWVSYSPDGRVIVSSGDDRAVRLWDPATMRERAVLRGHSTSASALAFSADGRRLLTGGGRTDGTVCLWDLESGTLLRRFEGRHGLEVSGLGFTPDGRQAVSSSVDQTVRLWDVENGKQLRTHALGSFVWDLTVLANGRRALAACEGSRTGEHPAVALWDLDTDKVTVPFTGHAGGAGGVTLLPDGRRVLSGGRNGDPRAMRLWDLETGKELHCFRLPPDEAEVWKAIVSRDGRRALARTVHGHDGIVWVWDIEAHTELAHFGANVHSAVFSPDGGQVLYGGNDALLRLWDLKAGKDVRRFEGHTRTVRSVSISPDGSYAVSAGADQTVRLWDVATGKEVRPVQGQSELCRAVAVSPDARRVLAGYGDGGLRLWDLAGGKEGRLLIQHARGTNIVAFSPDGRRALSGSDDGTLRLWDVETGAEMRRMDTGTAVYYVAFTPGGDQAYSACADGSLRHWDVASGRELRRLTRRLGKVYFMAVSPDGRRALSWGDDKALRLWELEAGGEPRTLGGATEHVYAASFSPDGRQVACAGDDPAVQLWSDLDRDQPRGQVFAKWHTERVRSLTFAPDGRTLASAAQDGRVILWDAATGNKLREWQLPGLVYAVAFAADGRHLATANGNGTIYILRLPPP